MKKIAVVIVGAVASGKTTLANQLSKELKGFEIINEESTGNYFKIINEINGEKHTRAIYEHCHIYTQLALFSKEYDKVLFCFMKLNENLLIKNYDNRKSTNMNKKGDYIKINPVNQQNNLILEVKEWKNLVELLPNVQFLELPINSPEEYETTIIELTNLIEKSS